MQHGLRVVVVSQRPVGSQPGGHALVPAVHGHQVDVDVDQQIRRGGPLVDLNVLTPLRLAQMDQVLRVLGVVLGEQSVGRKRVVHPMSERVTQLVLGHPSMQGQRRHQHHVVNAGVRRHVEHGLDDHLADVGCLHRRQGQRDVVETDRELHAGEEQRRQWVAVAQRVEQGVADGAVRIVECLHGLGCVDHPAPLGQGLDGEALAVPEKGRRGGLVHLEHETGTAAHRVRLFAMSKAILTAPRRPAAPAWATASSKRARG